MDKKSKLSKYFVPIILIVLLLFNIYLKSEINSLKNDLNNFHNNLNRSIEDISRDVHYSVSEALEMESSLIHSFSYEYEGPIEDGFTNLKLSLIPKEISNQHKYYFAYDLDGKEELVPAQAIDSSSLEADITFPINQDIQPKFIVEHNNLRKIESLDYIYSLEERLLEQFNPNFPGYTISHRDDKSILQLRNTRYSLDFNSSSYNYEEKERDESYLESVVLYFELNGKIKEQFEMTLDNMHSSYVAFYLYEVEDYTLELSPNDKLDIYAIAEHGHGYKVKINFDQIYLDEKGEIRDNYEYNHNNKVIID